MEPKPQLTGLDHPTRIGIKTADGFNYAINVGAKTNDNYFMTVAVSATLAKTNSPDESKKLADKLAQESKLNQWTYLVPNWTLEPLLKNARNFWWSSRQRPKPTRPRPTRRRPRFHGHCDYLGFGPRTFRRAVHFRRVTPVGGMKTCLSNPVARIASCLAFLKILPGRL